MTRLWRNINFPVTRDRLVRLAQNRLWPQTGLPPVARTGMFRGFTSTVPLKYAASAAFDAAEKGPSIARRSPGFETLLVLRFTMSSENDVGLG